MKLLNIKIAMLLVLVLNTSSQNVYAEYSLELSGASSKTEYIGESMETYLTVYMSNSSNNFETIVRKNLVDGNSRVIPVQNYKGGSVSKDGSRVMWLEQTVDENSIPTSILKLYNFEDSTEVEILNSNEDVYSPPIFLSDDKILFRLGSGGVYTQIVVYDLSNNTQETIYTIESEQTETQSYTIKDIKLSGDGSTILFLENHLTYQCMNCVILNNEIINIYKFETGTVDVIVSDLIFPNYEITHNAEYVLFTNYVDAAEIKKVRLENNSIETIDLSQYLNLSHPSLNSVHNIAISEDASTIAFSGLSEFKDNRQYSYNENYLDGANKQRQFFGVYVLDFEENKVVLANKINNSQILPARLVSLSKDGSKVRLRTSEQSQKFISYDIDYSFHADAAVTGAWYNPEQSGHGLMVNFFPDADHPKGQAIVTWYTVDLEGNPLWLIMQANFNGNTLTGDAMQVTGSTFGNYNPADTTRTTWGTLSIEFSSCKTALLSYQPNQEGYEVDELNLSRLSYQSGIGCLD